MSFYYAIAAVSCLTLLVLATLVHESSHIDDYVKRRFYVSYTVLFLVVLAEWASIAMNGAPAWTIGIHKVIKALDYILTPMAGVFFAMQIISKKDIRRHIWMYVLLGANIILEIISIFTGWTFYVDADNVYHHGKLYLLYSLMFCSAILFVFIIFSKYSKNFKHSSKVPLFSIVAFVTAGVALQEFYGNGMRTSSLVVCIGSVFLYIHYNDFLQQQYEDTLKEQKHLLETDALTGVYSRYSYAETVRDLSKEENAPSDLAVFSIDINGLKHVNDTLGHDSGDILIKNAAQCISEVFGKHGKCFRVGGDEFVAILTAKNVSVAGLLHELDREIERVNRTCDIKLSLSTGYALSSEHSDFSVVKLAKIADKSMYQSKEAHYHEIGEAPPD